MQRMQDQILSQLTIKPSWLQISQKLNQDLDPSPGKKEITQHCTLPSKAENKIIPPTQKTHTHAHTHVHTSEGGRGGHWVVGSGDVGGLGAPDTNRRVLSDFK